MGLEARILSYARILYPFSELRVRTRMRCGWFRRGDRLVKNPHRIYLMAELVADGERSFSNSGRNEAHALRNLLWAVGRASKMGPIFD